MWLTTAIRASCTFRSHFELPNNSWKLWTIVFMSQPWFRDYFDLLTGKYLRHQWINSTELTICYLFISSKNCKSILVVVYWELSQLYRTEQIIPKDVHLQNVILIVINIEHKSQVWRKEERRNYMLPRKLSAWMVQKFWRFLGLM